MPGCALPHHSSKRPRVSWGWWWCTAGYDVQVGYIAFINTFNCTMVRLLAQCNPAGQSQSHPSVACMLCTNPPKPDLQVLTQSHFQPQQHQLPLIHPGVAVQQQQHYTRQPHQPAGISSCSSSSSWPQQQQQQQCHRGCDVRTNATAAFQGPDGYSGGEQSSFMSAFWRFLRPHTIRGTILGTSAVVSKVGREDNVIKWRVRAHT